MSVPIAPIGFPVCKSLTNVATVDPTAFAALYGAPSASRVSAVGSPAARLTVRLAEGGRIVVLKKPAQRETYQ